MLAIFLLFLIIATIQSLYFTYLFQIKEYRWDRMKSFIKEEGILKFFYLISFKLPAKKHRNALILGMALFPIFFIFLLLIENRYWFGYISLILSPFISFMLVYIAVLITRFPAFISRSLTISKASQKVASSKAICIAITGSYGKTSVKEYLYQILSSKYNVGKTDKNMNTDVGVALSILKNLKKNTQYFIAEIGAYHIGEIAKTCEIFRPTYSILTALGNQHIDLFGSKENLIQAKSELFINLPEHGKAYFNLDTPESKKIAEKTPSPHTFFSVKTSKADIFAYNIEYNPEKITAVVLYNKVKIHIKTSLTGRHILSNLLPCIAVALDLGMKKEDIEQAIKDLKPLENKLNVFKHSSDALILDNAYNSNVEGFISGIETMKSFPQKTKIVVSKGIIELGVEKSSSYEKIIKHLEKTSIMLYTTDSLFKKLSNTNRVKLFSNEENILDELLKTSNDQTLILLEGKFTDDFIRNIKVHTKT